MKKIFIYAFASLLLVGGVGCEKFEDFGNANVNPAATTEANVGALLTNTLAGLGGWAFDSRPGYYAQYFSETQYPDASLYSLPQLSFTGNYSGSLYDLQNIIKENKSNNQNVVAKIVQQYIFWNITDRWGDVPYSQALQGVNVTQPVYDKQEDIYKGMIGALTAAVSSFDGSGISGDIIYNGDVASWKRFANSLRMIMAIQLSKKYPGASDYAATQFKAALNDTNGSISTNAQNFKLVPASGFKSDYWNTYDGRKDLAESKTMTDLMGSTLGGDARQNAFGGASEVAGNNATSNVGVPYGVARASVTAFTDANANWARVLRGDLRVELSPVYILTAAQVWLARAEAANLGWTSEVLATTYSQGITLSFEQWGAGTPAASYFTQTSVALGAVGSADNVKNIAIQRYVASYPDGHQGWNIWRKTGFPTLTPAPAAAVGKQIVRRYTYAASEFTSNKTNVTAAVARIPGGVDSQEARVWWDQ